MNWKNSLIAGGLIVIIIVIVGIFVIIPAIDNSTGSNSTTNSSESSVFNNSTPEAMAISIARLNYGPWGFDQGSIKSVHLTSDRKQWIVEIYNSVYKDDFEVLTVDVKTWKSKKGNGEWKSLDELKARYIAEIQGHKTDDGTLGEPYKVIMGGKEIWKVQTSPDEYVYVDLTTGKSKNTWKWFNKVAGTDGWLTLKEVDNTISKIGMGSGRNALRDLYPE